MGERRQLEGRKSREGHPSISCSFCQFYLGFQLILKHCTLRDIFNSLLTFWKKNGAVALLDYSSKKKFLFIGYQLQLNNISHQTGHLPLIYQVLDISLWWLPVTLEGKEHTATLSGDISECFLLAFSSYIYVGYSLHQIVSMVTVFITGP